MKVGIIIPFYGGNRYLKRLISSMCLDDGIYDKKVFLVDNSLPTEKVDLNILEGDVNVEIIESGVGLGFGKACNIGFNRCKELGFDYILIVNQDGYFHQNTLNLMIYTLVNNKDVSVALPVLMELDSNKVESFFTHVYLTPLTDLVSDLLVNKVKSFYPINSICGACLILRVSDYREFDYLFDPLFHMYYEDEDLCLRLRGLNLNMIIIPDAIFHHFHSNTNNYANASFADLLMRFRSRQIFQLKNKEKLTFKRFTGFFLFEFSKVLGFLFQLELKLMFAQILSIISFVFIVPRVIVSMNKQELILRN